MYPRKLSTLVLFITNRCNCRCPFCFNTMLNKSHQELSTEEYLKIAINCRNLLQVIFGGGEPFLRDDITEIAEAFYTHASVKLLSISTNGYSGKDSLDKINRIADVCKKAILNIEVSIDALQGRHDELRALPGIFDKAIELCHDIVDLRMKYYNINLIVNTTVSTHNIDDVLNLHAFLSKELKNGLSYHNIIYDCRNNAAIFSKPDELKKIILIESTIRKKAKLRKSDLFTFIINKYYIEFINKLLLAQRVKKKVLFRCNAGRKISVILPEGKVSPCEPFIFEKTYGDLPEYNIRDFNYSYTTLLQDPGFKKMQQFILKKKCRICNWSCSAITSMLYSPENWLKLLTIPKVIM